jgi:hypothetical protein
VNVRGGGQEVNHADFPWLELTRLNDPIHDMDIMFTLRKVQERSIDFDFTINTT